jgi:hypothetical protein
LVKINGVLDREYCADSGAFKSCVSRRDVEALVKIDTSVEAHRLQQPIQCELVGGTTMEVSETVYLTLALRTAAGPVNINDPVECLVVDGDGEFLLGRDVLTRLGIDVEKQLELLASTGHDEDDGMDEDPVVGAGPDDMEIRSAVETMIARALEEGFPRDRVDRLRAVIYAYDVWRIKLGADPPAKVPPLQIRLKKGSVPFKSKARKYPPELQRFLDDFNSTLVKLGWVYENPNARWACAALPVKKSGGDYRQTNDYKPVNCQAEPLAGVMPNLDVDLEKVIESRCFGLFDFIKGYWQLPLHEDSQEMLSYMTHRKIYTPKRVPQGCSDAALYFQATMEKCFASLLYKHLLVWIDDLLLYASDIDTYLIKLEELLQLVDHFGLKLSALKSCVYKKEVKWCGKLITGEGVRHDPERVHALTNLPYPSTAGELQQFTCSTNWMRSSIIDYARLVRPLQDKFDAVMRNAKKRTKRVANNIPITLTREELAAFDAVKEALTRTATLAFPKPDAETCLFTDASDVGWSVIVTQVSQWRKNVPVHEQHHELLVCMGGTFTGAQRHWSVIEKEAFPIVTACDKLTYLLLRPKGFRMYCDHRNLIHVFAPAHEVKKHVRGKLLRWAMKLTEHRYEIEHIEGVKNVWADMVSRWAGTNRTNNAAVKSVRRKRGRAAVGETQNSPREVRFRMTLRPFQGEDFDWPDVDAIAASQQKHITVKPRGLAKGEHDLWCSSDRIWIPEPDRELSYRILVTAHCGPQGHRGRDTLMATVQRRFWIARLRATVDSFLRGCLMCHHVKGGEGDTPPVGRDIQKQGTE